jgi:hypothetical protein
MAIIQDRAEHNLPKFRAVHEPAKLVTPKNGYSRINNGGYTAPAGSGTSLVDSSPEWLKQLIEELAERNLNPGEAKQRVLLRVVGKKGKHTFYALPEGEWDLESYLAASKQTADNIRRDYLLKNSAEMRIAADQRGELIRDPEYDAKLESERLAIAEAVCDALDVVYIGGGIKADEPILALKETEEDDILEMVITNLPYRLDHVEEFINLGVLKEEQK